MARLDWRWREESGETQSTVLILSEKRCQSSGYHSKIITLQLIAFKLDLAEGLLQRFVLSRAVLSQEGGLGRAQIPGTDPGPVEARQPASSGSMVATRIEHVRFWLTWWN